MSKILAEASKKLAEKGMEKLNAADDKTNGSKVLFKSSDESKESKGLLAKNDLSGQTSGKSSRAQMTERVLGGVMSSMDTTQELNVSGYGSFGI